MKNTNVSKERNEKRMIVAVSCISVKSITAALKQNRCGRFVTKCKMFMSCTLASITYTSHSRPEECFSVFPGIPQITINGAGKYFNLLRTRRFALNMVRTLFKNDIFLKYC